MTQKLIRLSQHYVMGLRTYLEAGARGGLVPALELGHLAVAIGVETLELARIHERALDTLELAKRKDGYIKRAEVFFTAALTPIVATHRAAQQSNTDLKRLTQTLDRRTLELAATNRRLKGGVRRRKSAESALKKSRLHYARLLKDSLHLQKGLRQLTHQVLVAQEAERKKLSLELQDEVAQTLLGINVRLLSLRRESQNHTKGLDLEIASTQRLVAKSAKSVRQVARAVGKS
jgi:signal transduction histidine kinase